MNLIHTNYSHPARILELTAREAIDLHRTLTAIVTNPGAMSLPLWTDAHGDVILRVVGPASALAASNEPAWQS